jgi:hypothetical protein
LILFDCSLASPSIFGVVNTTRHQNLLELGFGRSQESLPTPTSFAVAVSRKQSSSHFSPRFRVACHMIFETSSFKRRSQLGERQMLNSVVLGLLFNRRSLATVTSLLQLRNCIRFADVQHPTAATRLRSKF